MIHTPPPLNNKVKKKSGFTLIELSIVLVIIGLVVGGVLVGQDLIKGAELRSAGSQVQSYQTSVNTFRIKYNAIPGDIKAASALQFGFQTRTGDSGRGDGNRIIQNRKPQATTNPGTSVLTGELVLFWRDISDAGLINETFNTATEGTNIGTNDGVPGIDLYFPKSKLQSNYVYVWSGGPHNYISAGESNGKNYFAVSIPTNSNGSFFQTAPGMTALQAKQLDEKFDDGMPQSGKAIAAYPYTHYGTWASAGSWWDGVSPGVAAGNDTRYCYDNDNNASDPMEYATDFEPEKLKCALSFEMQ